MNNLVAVKSSIVDELFVAVPFGMIDDNFVFIIPSALKYKYSEDFVKILNFKIDFDYMILKDSYNENLYKAWYTKNRLLFDLPAITKYNCIEYLPKKFVDLECGIFYYIFQGTQKFYLMKLSDYKYFTMPFTTFNVFLKTTNKNSFLDTYITQIMISDFRHPDNMLSNWSACKSPEIDFKYNIVNFF